MLLESGTLLAKWLSACALSPILALDIIPCVAIGIVVVNIRKNRVPRTDYSHRPYLLSSNLMAEHLSSTDTRFYFMALSVSSFGVVPGGAVWPDLYNRGFGISATSTGQHCAAEVAIGDQLRCTDLAKGQGAALILYLDYTIA